MKTNKLDELQFKNLIIGILIAIIIFGGVYFINYHQNVNRVINFNIHTNLFETRLLLNRIDDGLTNYENEEISKEEFQTLLSNCRSSTNIGFNIYTTSKYTHISKRFKYVDIKKLDYYIKDLSLDQISDEGELEFHKKNLLEICKLWRELNIESDNYLLPQPELKEILIETKKLSEEGDDRLFEDEE